MSAQDLLSQDEIDALLHGADEKPAEEDSRDANGVASYDITSQERIVRGRMPTLEMITNVLLVTRASVCLTCFVVQLTFHLVGFRL